MSDYKRLLNIDFSEAQAVFLWGPRKVGKTTFLKAHFPQAVFYDLLDRTLQSKLTVHLGFFKEELLAKSPSLVIVDEVQKVPSLLDDIHWLLENTSIKFVLCGSSARKLKRGAANLLGGRAWRYQMLPLTTAEIPQFDLNRALNHGLLPQHYRATRVDPYLESYVLDYISEEIQSEALVRNVGLFAKFMDAVGATNGQLLNYANVARECGVNAKTVRAYYQILEDTLLGYTLQPWTLSKKKRLIETATFYLCDVSLVRVLKEFIPIAPKTEEFGRAFEHFLINEIRAYLIYSESRQKISFWRTSTGQEVDLIVGNMALAIEFKAKANVLPEDLKGLFALQEDQSIGQAIAVTLDEQRRQLNSGILIVPWQEFCKDLWAGKWI